MRTQYQPCIIFSAARGDVSMVKNSINTLHAEQHLKALNIPYSKLLGSYNGVEELSFLVTAEHLDHVMFLAKFYNQHSILLRDNENNASLFILDTSVLVKLGKMVSVTVEEALANDSWSFHPKLNKYFICKGA